MIWSDEIRKAIDINWMSKALDRKQENIWRTPKSSNGQKTVDNSDL